MNFWTLFSEIIAVVSGLLVFGGIFAYQKVRCKKCNFVYRYYRGHCPLCGRQVEGEEEVSIPHSRQTI